MIYEFAIIDFDVYEPYWFECNCSKSDFEKECSRAIDMAVKELRADPILRQCINGSKVAERAIKTLCEKFERTHPDYYVNIPFSFPGEVEIKEDWETWPTVVSEESKKEIVESWKEAWKDIGEKELSAKDDTWFQEMLQRIREQCFHMTNEEATIVVDEFIEKNPKLLDYKTREWLIQNS